MMAWKMILSRVAMLLLSLVIMGAGTIEANQKASTKTSKKIVAKRAAAKKSGRKRVVAKRAVAKNVTTPQKRVQIRPSAVVGELEDDSEPMADDDESVSVDQGSTVLLKNSKRSRGSKGKSKKQSEIDKENKNIKKREEMQKKINEGFSKAEDFHKLWYNLTSEKIKISLKNLTKFCKVACTKKQCMNDKVANNCHLMCPESTTKQCPDPLKRKGEEGEEVPLNMEEKKDDDPFPGDEADSDPDIAEDITESIDEGDKDIMDREG